VELPDTPGIIERLLFDFHQACDSISPNRGYLSFSHSYPLQIKIKKNATIGNFQHLY
jgi:hypothetical protein